MRLHRLLLPALLLASISLSAVEKATTSPNTDPTYLSLRNPAYSGETYSVQDFKLSREGAVFTLTGSIYPFAPVKGKVTGAVFVGTGTMELDPPTRDEKRQISYLTKEPRMVENFDELFLRFSDRTFDEIKAAAKPTSGSGPQSALDEGKKKFRSDLNYNIAGRLLQDVNATDEPGIFVALIKGKKYSGKMAFALDPHGVNLFGFPLAPEEVALLVYDEVKFGVWNSYHLLSEYKTAAASSAQRNSLFDIDRQKIDVTMEKGGRIEGKSTTSFQARTKSLAVLPLSLYPTLRVDYVTDGKGAPLQFVQEEKQNDPQFFVILDTPLKAGESAEIITHYAGKEVMSSEGGNNYFMNGGARDSWYPNAESMGNFENYELTIRVPKGLQVVATGEPVSQAVEGNQNVSVWKTVGAETNSGFQVGQFRRLQSKIDKLNFTVESYANEATPDILERVKQYIEATGSGAVGTMSTVDLGKKAMAEGGLSVEYYSWLYGPSAMTRLAMTQQTAVNYGQAWPGLVYLPITYFLDSTQRHNIGIDDAGYFRVVASHEVAHQWWGDTVGFASYRDQWMSEGFAEASAAMYMGDVLKKDKDVSDFWKEEREMMLKKNQYGFRAVDVGPLTMGYRLGTGKTGTDITRRLIYPKGGYVLHMIRMMMWSNKTKDETYRQMMTDFTKTYMRKNATTEDFKAMVEKYMTAEMDLDNNKKMDWFFNEYVYGTEVPSYKFEPRIEPGTDGGSKLVFKLTQSGVSPEFKMIVPVYVDLGDRVVRLGFVTIVGNSSVERTVNLPAMPKAPKRLLINYHHDVLETGA